MDNRIRALLQDSPEYWSVCPVDPNDRRTTYALVEWLHERAISYSAIAKFSGLSEQQFSHWRRKTTPRLKEQEAIVTALNLVWDFCLSLDTFESPRGLSFIEARDWAVLLALTTQ